MGLLRKIPPEQSEAGFHLLAMDHALSLLNIEMARRGTSAEPYVGTFTAEKHRMFDGSKLQPSDAELLLNVESRTTEYLVRLGLPRPEILSDERVTDEMLKNAADHTAELRETALRGYAFSTGQEFPDARSVLKDALDSSYVSSGLVQLDI